MECINAVSVIVRTLKIEHEGTHAHAHVTSYLFYVSKTSFLAGMMLVSKSFAFFLHTKRRSGFLLIPHQSHLANPLHNGQDKKELPSFTSQGLSQTAIGWEEKNPQASHSQAGFAADLMSFFRSGIFIPDHHPNPHFPHGGIRSKI
jgi:hypothetical protein